MESPFQTTHAIISEPVNSFDDIRIIAGGGSGRLTRADRDILRAAAEESAGFARAYVFVNAKLEEAQAQIAALRDQLADARKAAIVQPQLQPRPQVWSYSSGPMKMEVL